MSRPPAREFGHYLTRSPHGARRVWIILPVVVVGPAELPFGFFSQYFASHSLRLLSVSMPHGESLLTS
jgi:hypothetical protein